MADGALWRELRKMKNTLIILAMLACGFTRASGQGKILSNDPLTGLPLYPGTNPGTSWAMHLLKCPIARSAIVSSIPSFI